MQDLDAQSEEETAGQEESMGVEVSDNRADAHSLPVQVRTLTYQHILQ